ncbi:MAG: HisA/HisF-related TIM barrel protein [Aromatoleum sp.]|jgi:phosphoribosylformimino-5-aminoimidazole carboxamide ribotide isomerase|uniref:HisA/HisF-related TIM barrel protein n=1 Tax=Aromatoleum sp. TaxID=2307007 RepID=UPI002895ACB6|nr:HisA/HisF-related TIM barrel protein [Aromatoleum sp.]MDT3672122.1 HisA/HisF-related TIM barrel protein [Aromatoleum sp.]
MQVIPVIDLLAGQVVRAVRGERSAYRPVQSELCDGSEPLVVTRALLDYTASETLYIADLDALNGGAVQAGVLAALLSALPQTAIWLDGGFRGADEFAALALRLGTAAQRVTPVFGSESLVTPAAVRDCFADPRRAILSLDRRGNQLLDPAGCWTTEALWPDRLIVMTLDRVGAFAGPDLDTLAAIRRRAPGASLIGAGGIRDEADLEAAAASGAEAWLVASALHDRRLIPHASRR